MFRKLILALAATSAIGAAALAPTTASAHGWHHGHGHGHGHWHGPRFRIGFYPAYGGGYGGGCYYVKKLIPNSVWTDPEARPGLRLSAPRELIPLAPVSQEAGASRHCEARRENESPPLSSPAKAGDPVRRSICNCTEASVVTGCPACAGHDNGEVRDLARIRAKCFPPSSAARADEFPPATAPASARGSARRSSARTCGCRPR